MKPKRGGWRIISTLRQVPYIGPNALTMKQLIQKHETHRILKAKDVAVPDFTGWLARATGLPQVSYPAFVKPSNESRSVGISDDSVAHTSAQLQRQIAYIQETYRQPALVEEYLPGDEYTVLMLGNGEIQELLAGNCHRGSCPLRKISHSQKRPARRGPDPDRAAVQSRAAEANDLCRRATDALRCWDHVRVDMRVDAGGRLKIIEVNGIPGLKPGKSWSPQIYSLYHPFPGGADEAYRHLIHRIVDSGLSRYNLI